MNRNTNKSDHQKMASPGNFRQTKYFIIKLFRHNTTMTTPYPGKFLLLLCLIFTWQLMAAAADDNQLPNTTPVTNAAKTEAANDPTASKETDATETEEAEESEVNITAERMEMQLEKHQIELSGNVLIEDDTMKLTAQKMTIFLDNDNKMEHIEAEGMVTVRKLDSSESAMGDRGTYDAKNDVIILTGNCTILQGKNAMTGHQVVYDRKKQTINLQGATITLPMKRSDGKGGNSIMGNLFGGNDEKADDDKQKKLTPADATEDDRDAERK